ncbi:MAG: hypothetical protein ABIP75_07540 [Pyrinomonadaceae bacterium]
MKFRLTASIFLLSTTVFTSALAQTSSPNSDPITRPRVVANVRVKNEDRPDLRPTVASNRPQTESIGNRSLGMGRLRARIDEAERLLRSRTEPTAYLPKSTSLSYVTVAALDPAQSRIHLIVVPKETFLKRGSMMSLSTSMGTPVTLRVLRANGVNTAVTVVDQSGRNFTPLLVQYPVERGGRLAETAYYTSVHPMLVSNDVVSAGQSYLHSMLDLSAKRLRAKNIMISPQLVGMAERLCIVEHSDHTRFNSENRKELFNEIYSLYGLNEQNTYRYAVSTAGAGGIAQMIPATYQTIRRLYPQMNLTPDFVTGMRNHSNALDAMLLYMHYTWNEMSNSSDVQNALNRGIAAPYELMAAGYNSNPAKIPKYLREGGSGWRSLIPHETQLYLTIYKSLDTISPIRQNH